MRKLTIYAGIAAILSVSGGAGISAAHAAKGIALKNLSSRKCAHIPGHSKQPGTRVTQWSCVNQPNVRWQFNVLTHLPGGRFAAPTVFQIKNLSSGMCLTATGTRNGAAVVQRPCGPAKTWSQTWVVTEGARPGYSFISNYGYSKKCLDVPGYRKGNGVALVTWTCGYQQKKPRFLKANQLFST
jgi:hypothetical protein